MSAQATASRSGAPPQAPDAGARARDDHEIAVCQLGEVPYGGAMEIQRELCRRRQLEALPDVLLLLEHPPTYTRGRRAGEGELPLGERFYRARGIDVVGTDRGGRVTYHGPGQLVAYSIARTTDVVAHVRTLEAALVAALADEGLVARSRSAEGRDFTGVWVEDRKIASIGVHLSRGVTTHGLAANVINDLDPFSWIVPCGLPGVRMTSLALELGLAPRADAADRLFVRFRSHLARRLCELAGGRARPVAARELGIQTAAGGGRAEPIVAAAAGPA